MINAAQSTVCLNTERDHMMLLGRVSHASIMTLSWQGIISADKFSDFVFTCIKRN